MVKKKGDGKIGGVKPSEVKATDTSAEVKSTEAVGQVAQVAPTTAVSGAKGSASISKRRPTRVMTYAEREQIFKMVEEEAERMFGGSGISEERKRTVAEAVKMAIDSGLMPEEEQGKKKK